jgi:hypothetical protein
MTPRTHINECARDDAWTDAETWHLDPRARKLMAEIDVAEQLSDWAAGRGWADVSNAMSDRIADLIWRLECLRDEIVADCAARYMRSSGEECADHLWDSAICHQKALDQFRKEKLVTVHIDIAPDTGNTRVAA